MNAEEIVKLVRTQIGDSWEIRNLHDVDLKEALVTPQIIQVIDRQMQNGKIYDRLTDVWLVLVEHPATQSGYWIVTDLDGTRFGLAIKGFASDEHYVLIGWNGDFLSTYHSM